MGGGLRDRDPPPDRDRDTPPPNRITERCKTLPCSNFVVGGKYCVYNMKYAPERSHVSFINWLASLRSPYKAVIATFVGTLAEYFGQTGRQSHIVTPVDTGSCPWRGRRNNFTLFLSCLKEKIFYFLPPANVVCEGRAWLLRGGGRAWLLPGVGHAWFLGGGGTGMVAPGEGACGGYDEIRRYGQWAGGTHPTGMHSCLDCCHIYVAFQFAYFLFF